MPREIYTAAGTIADLPTTVTDVIPLTAAGETILARVRVANKSTSATTLTAALWSASAELARILPGVTIGAGEIIELDVRVAPAQRLRMQAGAASAIDVSIVHGVRQT